MKIKDSIKKVFGADHGHQTTTDTAHTATPPTAGTGPGTGTVTEHRTVRDPDPHVPAGTAAGHSSEAQRHHASTMPQPEMESEVWPDVHGRYREASKEARLTNQNARLAEEELEKLRLAQSSAHEATSRQQQLREEAARAQAQFGQYDNKRDEVARAAEAARMREQQTAQLAQEAEAAKRAALEKQRAAQGMGPGGVQAERELQAATAEIEANKRRAMDLQQRQHQLEELEAQRLAAERDTGRIAQAIAQDKQNVHALEEQLAAAKARLNDGLNKLNHYKSIEAEWTNKIRQLGGGESPTALLRELESHHQGLVQRAAAAQKALEEERRLQGARQQEACSAEQRYKDLLARLDPANADVARAKQDAERLAAEMRENDARAHDLAQRHQGMLAELEKHMRTVELARTDAEKHMRLYNKYENEAEAAHNRKQEHWGEANRLVGQMGETETTKFSSMQEKIKEFGSKLFHQQNTEPTAGTTTTTTEHRTMGDVPGQTTTTHHMSSTTGPHVQQVGQNTGNTVPATGVKQQVPITGQRTAVEE